MNLKYLTGALISLPLLPLMYYQGKKIKASVPKLPEATGTEGRFIIDSKNSNSLKIITLGESTIAGVGVKTHKEGFTGALVRELASLARINIDWKVYARSGYTAKKATEKLIPKIEEKNIDLIVVGLGGNDAFKLHTPKKWRKDIQAFIESLRTKFPRTPIVFCNMPPIKEFPAFTPLIKSTIGNLVELFGTELEKITANYDDVFYYGEILTLKDWKIKFKLDAEQKDFFSDGVHPSKLTYQTWAIDIAQKIWREGKIIKRN